MAFSSDIQYIIQKSINQFYALIAFGDIVNNKGNPIEDDLNPAKGFAFFVFFLIFL